MSAWFRTVVSKGVRCVRYKMLNLFRYRSKVIGLIYTLSVVVVFGWLLSHIPIYHDIKTTVFVYLVAIVSALIALVVMLFWLVIRLIPIFVLLMWLFDRGSE